MLNIFLFYLLMFSDYRIGILSVSDWALIILLIKSLIYEPVIKINQRERIALFFIFVGIILSTMMNISKDYFLIVDFIQSGGKFLIYILALYVVPKYMRMNNVCYIKHLKIFLSMATFGGLIQRIIVLVFGRSSWPLYSLGGNWFGLTMENSMFNNAGMMRARSFWSEPAHFAIFISLIFMLLLFTEKEKLHKYYYVIYIVGIILANSLSGYGIMIAVFVMYLVNFKDKKSIGKAVIGGFVFAVALITLISTNGYLLSRVENLFNLKDHSGVVRTVGGFHILEYIPWYGVGVGNHANFYKTLSNLNPIWFSGSGEFYNNILLAVITMGYIGALGFILLQFEILKKDKKLFVVFMVTHFGWGKLYTAPIWVFLILYLVLQEKDKNNIMVEDFTNG